MKLNFKNQYANVFLSRLEERFPQYVNDIEISEYGIGFIISLKIEDKTHENPLSISMSVNHNEITIGHSFDDHEHFDLGEEPINKEFINQAFEYIDVLCLGSI